MKKIIAMLCLVFWGLAVALANPVARVIKGYEPNKTIKISNQWSGISAEANIKGTKTPYSPGIGVLAGGPDDFGYYWLDSNDPGGPVFNWIEISATGTNMGLSDDSYFWGIPFVFSFYGNNYDTIAVGSNGTVYFQNQYLGLGNTPIPSPNGYGVDIFTAVYWTDLNPGSGGAVYYQVMGDTLVVEWSGVPIFGTTDYLTFEVILIGSTNEIFFQYLDAQADLGSVATVGIQASPTQPPLWGLQYSYFTASLSNNLAIRFYRPIFSDDVGPYAIRVPGPFVDPLSIVIPVITFKNYGTNPATFDVTLNIDSSGVNVYTDDQTGISLAPNDTIQLSFANWNTGPSGTVYNLTTFTTYAPDLFPGNDTLATTTTSFPATWLLNSPFRTVIPSIDGVINPAEWADALKQDVSDIFGYGGVPFPAGSVFLYVKNDSDNLYLAVDGIVDITTDNDDVFWQYYDDNNDGAYPLSPDSTEGQLIQSWWSTGDTIWFTPITSDLGFLGQYVTALNGLSGISSGNMQYELVLPLVGTGGLNEALQASVGDTIALWFFAGDASTFTIYGWWPTQATGGWGNPADMGDIVLSTGTGIEENAERFASDGIYLYQNHPNPFREKTTIRYTIQDARYKIQNISLKIYNSAGQLVKQFNHLTTQPFNQVIWNGEDEHGKPVPAGIYFYKLNADECSKTAKMIILK